jgi:hypothetical protein
MKRANERGEGRLGGLIVLVLLAALGLAAFNVGPMYFAHYDFQDKVNEVCRLPRYRASDDEIMRLLMVDVRARGLDPWIGPDSFRITTSEHRRRIDLYYEREVKVLPGWKRLFKFEYTAEQPLI